MKTSFGLLLTIIMLSSCENSDKELLIDDSSNEFRNVTQTISTQEFDNIKNFILENGDKQTYSNMYNNNPHFTFNGFDAYLNPEIGQSNINCDPNISDFNKIVIRDQNSDPQYYHIHIIRQGDIKNDKITTQEGMIEKNVYLLKYYDYDLNLMETNLYGYIDLIRNEIDSK